MGEGYGLLRSSGSEEGKISHLTAPEFHKNYIITVIVFAKYHQSKKTPVHNFIYISTSSFLWVIFSLRFHEIHPTVVVAIVPSTL